MRSRFAVVAQACDSRDAGSLLPPMPRDVSAPIETRSARRRRHRRPPNRRGPRRCRPLTAARGRARSPARALGAGHVSASCPAGATTARGSCGPRCARAAATPAPRWIALCGEALRFIAARRRRRPPLARATARGLSPRIARGRDHRPRDRLFRAADRGAPQAWRRVPHAAVGPAEPASCPIKPTWTRQEIDHESRTPRPRCADARSPGSPTRSTRWCSRCRARRAAAHRRGRRQRSHVVRLRLSPASNEQPYRVGRALPGRPGRAQGDRGLVADDQGLGRAATRSACRNCCGPIRAWSGSSEETLCPTRASGPRGGQGVPLTPGRSIAVDPWRPCRTAARSGWTPPSRSRPARCSAR